MNIEEAKQRLDYIIKISRVDLYKPIQIAEVLFHSRTVGDIDIFDLATYQNASLRWRNEITSRLANKVSTSSARYQHDVWNETAMPPNLLAVLDEANKTTNGGVERYIYLRYGERQGTITKVISTIKNATPETFRLESLLDLFVTQSGIRRSIDKAYEIVVYSLFETVITALEAKVKVSVANESKPLLQEFSELTKVLLGVDEENLSWEQNAHIYRVGVTNAADRGLDMWANFGAAVQVKHLTLNEKLANEISNQVESDSIVIVCRDAEAKVIETVLKQIGFGKKVRGIIKESNLIEWYEKCLRGNFKKKLAKPLLERLLFSFESEFPQTKTLSEFLKERGYLSLQVPEIWEV